MHHSKSPPQSKKKPMKANRDSRFLALNRQLTTNERNSYSEAPMWRQWLTSRSWGWPSVCWVELNLRGRGETSGLVQKHLWLPSLQSRAGADHPEACWLEECLLFSGLGRAHRTLCLPGTGSLQTLALGLPASCQPYAVFFLWHPNMNVWIFA